MRYAEVDSKGKFTGAVYERIDDRIIADRAKYGNTLVAVDRVLVDTGKDGTYDFGKPTTEELARQVVTPEQALRDLSAAVATLSVRVKALEDAAREARQ